MSVLKTGVRAVALVALLFGMYSTVFADSVSRSGVFEGINNHTSNGGVSIIKTDDGFQIKLADDFFFDGAPDPKIAFGNDGKYAEGTIIRLLDSNTGAQVYNVPASIDVSKYNEVHIWCEKFNVGLAIAPLN